MNTSPEIADRLKLALELAVTAGRGTLKHFQKAGLVVDRKSDDSPVTVADREAETYIRNQLAERFPADGIIGEEFGVTEGTGDFRWIIDPIDGTKSFVAGVPLYGTLIGIEQAGQNVAGVIYIPGLDEMVYAAKGCGAWYKQGDAEPTLTRVSDAKSLADGVFVTSQVNTFARRDAFEAFNRLEKAAFITRTWGDCYGYLLVATGRAVAMVDPMLSVWDAAAIQPIMEEAGGAFVDWHGEPTIHSGEGIGANPHVMPEVLAICREYPRLP
ncbi:histidinol-phosphatase [Blastopirellula retiformator]|uniref:Histidinol-phosphatase n=1 Tax=Blastopirellula retiformator TaxID=2527970 RepID=A0A5C5V0Y3_9BACT|nr:histidinol-phosphatase [Blastopirellula retiformator]TWT31679.1 Histidinol-phosphatase [Blastopirellula retiformator]